MWSLWLWLQICRINRMGNWSLFQRCKWCLIQVFNIQQAEFERETKKGNPWIMQFLKAVSWDGQCSTVQWCAVQWAVEHTIWCLNWVYDLNVEFYLLMQQSNRKSETKPGTSIGMKNNLVIFQICDLNIF